MMELLDIKAVNKTSPYKVIESESVGFYDFETSSGVMYSVGFMKEENLMKNEAYQFIVANLNNQKSPRDTKLRDTIICLVDEFFRKNNSTLLYICETGDNKQRLRSRLFEYWFSTFVRKSSFTFLTSSVTDSDGQINYAAILLRNDNPKLTEIISDFSETISLLNQKTE